MFTNHRLFLIPLFLIASIWGLLHFKQPVPAGQVIVLNRDGQVLDHLTDGNHVQLQARLGAPASREQQVMFLLDPGEVPVGECLVPAGQSSCKTEVFPALGWYWAGDGSPAPKRVVRAAVSSATVGEAHLSVSPRPVVMVHGFSSDWKAWQKYLGPQGYLAGIGVPAFAVGDGQVPGVMNTGRIDQPAGRTHTLAENAAILGAYIEAVKKKTGAEQVDLLAHSMGGLITRYYIDRVMVGDEVGQLIMLGSPMLGTSCANLPAALGYYLPATFELRPSYIRDIFNPQITHRHGTPFFALAGTPITQAFQSPCTPVPTDIAVSYTSVSAIPLTVQTMPVLHTDLNTSPDVFQSFVRPLLQTPAGKFPVGEDAPAQNHRCGRRVTCLFHGSIPATWTPGNGSPSRSRLKPGSPRPGLPCTTPLALWMYPLKGRAAKWSRWTR